MNDYENKKFDDWLTSMERDVGDMVREERSMWRAAIDGLRKELRADFFEAIAELEERLTRGGV